MNAIVLLSGGLDSVVSMLIARKYCKILKAITFDYGQIAKEKEISASEDICKMYNIDHKIVELPFMKEDIKSGLIQNKKLDTNNIWVPNRNGLFINIAACYAETIQANWVICGFNAEEAVDFPDNSTEFIDNINKTLSLSTNNKVKVKSFVKDMNKEEIIKKAHKLGLKMFDIWSCYLGNEIPCGQCPSCIKNKAAAKKAGIQY
ncbi:7-cyano-7-deazaguanine synthase [Candidatus Syntrophocurvum alkaliphilum]|uniref:7-cyano-7-deazaguanine synthase n=1 Tax=Candidatus Syntrophocurvum alkaliphilum TaxID=2293317 RepID=A0A6I6DF49_9FIRM|nr:7-cyano-7-deazaguanine synthase QueC [Candidatus Syntrophocurvum alkaliphilum]QGT99274.1 7-cyano-7-deazaguanine synthase [Candidatus Syntrophocurvum alkaliphilum]